MRILVLGASGMVGNAICTVLNSQHKYTVIAPTRSELDLTNAAQVKSYFESHRFDAVIVSAGRVGGILANATYPVEFFNDNMAIAMNCMKYSAETGIKKLIYLGSSCIYPKDALPPIKEEALLTGVLEPTNTAYALAKIAGVKLCEFYRNEHGLDYAALMPCNLYGPGDNYNLESSHVIPAMLRKFHEAKIGVTEGPVVLWGSGAPRREFLHVYDLAAACELMLETDTEHAIYNVGYGLEIVISELARQIKSVVGFKGDIVWDTSKPDGVVSKIMDSRRMRKLFWDPKISLQSGLDSVYQSFLSEYKSGRLRM